MKFWLFVKLDQLPRFVDRPLDIVRQSRVGFGRNTSGHNLENIGAELDEQVIADVFDLCLAAQARVLPILQNFVQQMSVLLLLSGGINQARVRRRVLRLEILDRLKVCGVGDDFGKLL